MKPLRDVVVGDTVFRWLTGLDSTVELRVTAVTMDRIVCGPWQFDRQTGEEIDEDLGWGPTLPGSYIRTTPVSAEDD